jgi:hypothetical protein
MLGSVVADVAASIIHLRLHRAALEPSWQAGLRPESRPKMRKDVREFIRRLEAVGLTVEPTPGHYRVLRKGDTSARARRSGMLEVLSGRSEAIPQGGR